MRLRNTILTGAASYIQIGSLVLTQLVAIPLALRFLDEERFGLWSFVSQSLGYLLLLDFGVSNSLGRLLADPIHKGDERECSGWFNLVLAVLLIQAALILGVGVLLADPILRWFEIPAPLLPEARQLWLMMLVLNGLTFPLRLFPGVLVAQNRSYWVFAGSTIGAWCGLLAFYAFLKLGWSSLAYGFSAAAQIVVASGVPLIAALRGPNRFRVSFREIPWHHARELFNFSSAVFVIGVAVQVVFMSQSLIITKILGLGAVASFTVCSRVPMLLMQFIWRPFDAFSPRWQIFWARGELSPLREEFVRVFRFTMGLAALVMGCCFAMNRWFVFIFGKESLYAGKEFDFFFVLFVLVQVWNHCLSWGFILAKNMKGLTAAVVLESVMTIVLAVAGTRWFGLNGYIGFTALYGLTGFATWYVTLKAPAILGLGTGQLVRNNLTGLLLILSLLGCGMIAFGQFRDDTNLLLLAEVVLVLAALVSFVVLFRSDLFDIVRRFQKIRQGRSSMTSGAAGGPAG